jgi:hypothetical protein
MYIFLSFYTKLEFYMDSACRYNFKYDIVPIAYRTHAHNIIPVISGYVVKDGQWIELGNLKNKKEIILKFNYIYHISKVECHLFSLK